MLTTIAAVFLLAQAPAPPARGRSAPPQLRPEDLGGVTGQVMSASDSSPLRKATVTLRPADTGRDTPFIANTDAGGRFVFEQVPPGRYDLQVERNGYVTWYSDSRRTGGLGQRLSISKAERITGFAVRMIPQAVVTGRVLDEDGEPMARIQVQLKRTAYNQGRKTWVNWGGSVSTDDRGEYRIHGVVPGRFVVAASQNGGFRGEGPGPPRPPGQASRDTRPDDVYPLTYFPASPDPAQGTLLDVQAGANLSGIDFRLRKVPTVRVRGRVVRPGETRRPAMVIMTPAHALSSDMRESLNTMADSNGVFEMRHVLPGSYMLHVQDWDREQPLSGNLQVEVGRSHVDGVQVRLTPAVVVTGQVTYEDNAATPAGNVFLSLQAIGFPGGAGTQFKPDGTIAIKNVKPGRYQVFVGGLPAGYYAKSIKAGEQELIAGVPFEVAEASPAPIRVVVSPNGGQAEGTVIRDQKPVSGATVVLWPSGAGGRPSLHRWAATDSTGHFSIQGIPPGDYHLAAISGLETGAWQDPDVLKPYASRAERLTIQEKSRENKVLVEATL